MRTRFDLQLEELNLEMIKMGSLCERAIRKAVNKLLDTEDAGSQDVLEVDKLENEINQKEREIESLCMKLLLQQQPVARDLRQISSALKMISDMERIGDQAQDIAEIAKYVEVQEIAHRIHIEEMAEAAIKMVTGSIDSFVKKDLKAARQVAASDDVVDELFLKIKNALPGLIQNDLQNAEGYIDLIMIAKYFERIGDHAENIAKWVEYSITGRHEKAEWE